MFDDPLDRWLWATPTSLPTQLNQPAQKAILQDVRKLSNLGNLADPKLVNFWQDTAVQSTTPSPFHHERQLIAVAALALIIIRRQQAEATAALRLLTNHPLPELRANAIHYLGRAFTESGQAIPQPILLEMVLIAQQDKAFEPRFQARRNLQIAGQPLTLDNPGSVYDLKVTPMHNRRIFRTIAVRAEQTLRDLQRFIQHAFNWDNDHFFSFYMNGRKYDNRYRFACAYEEEHPPWAYEAVIGQLGLVPGHRFLYHFDYGNDHLFEIELLTIRPEIRPGNYPRLIDDHGKSPPQYA